MTITYKLKIVSLETRDEPIENTVSSVQWRLTGEEGTASSFMTGTANVVYDANSNYIEFAHLQEENVAAWVEQFIGEDTMAKYKKHIELEISAMLNVQSNQALPWSAQ